jgi:hypothetical protein
MRLLCPSLVSALALTLTRLPSLAQGKSSESDIPVDFRAPTSAYKSHAIVRKSCAVLDCRMSG